MHFCSAEYNYVGYRGGIRYLSRLVKKRPGREVVPQFLPYALRGHGCVQQRPGFYSLSNFI